MKKIITIILQILFIHIFPSAMVGLLLLFLSLLLGIVKLEWVEQGGNWLLAELLLFFVPSAVGIVNYDDMLSWQGFMSVLLIGLSTFIVIGSTAFIAEKLNNWKEREVLK